MYAYLSSFWLSKDTGVTETISEPLEKPLGDEIQDTECTGGCNDSKKASVETSHNSKEVGENPIKDCQNRIATIMHLWCPERRGQLKHNQCENVFKVNVLDYMSYSPKSFLETEKMVKFHIPKTSFDILRSIVYLGCGQAALVICPTEGGKINIPLRQRTGYPCVFYWDRKGFLTGGISAFGYTEAWVEAAGGSPQDRIVFEVQLLSNDTRDRVAKSGELFTLRWGPEYDVHLRPSTREAFLLHGDPEHAGKEFAPEYAQAIIPVVFGVNHGQKLAAIDTIAFRPADVPFKMVINGEPRLIIDDYILKAILSGCLAPSCSYDPTFDQCFTCIGPILLEFYESIVFEKLS